MFGLATSYHDRLFERRHDARIAAWSVGGQHSINRDDDLTKVPVENHRFASG